MLLLRICFHTIPKGSKMERGLPSSPPDHQIHSSTFPGVISGKAGCVALQLFGADTPHIYIIMCLTLKLSFLYEIIIDSCSVIGNNTENAYVPFTQSPPVVAFCKTIV